MVQEKKFKIDFEDGHHFEDSHHGGHLGYLTGTILATFDLEVTLILPTKFQVNGVNRFSRWPQWWPFWISDQKDLSCF